MVQYYNNILTVEARWMIDSGIMTESQYGHASTRKQVNVVRKACRGTSALVAYDSMPDRFKREIVNVLGCSPYEKVRVKQLEIRVEHSAEATTFFEDYRLGDGRKLKPEVQREYYANAIILEAIHRLIIDKKANKRAKGGGATRKWLEISEGVQELDRTKYPHSLPANERRLEDRYKRYKKEGYESLIHKNYQNVNASPVDSEEKESVLKVLISDPRNMDNMQVARMYNMMAEPMGWKPVSRAIVAAYREKFETDTYARRRGVSAFRNTKTMQVKRSAPTRPLYYLTLDGWDVELLYQERQLRKSGHSVTTYSNRPTVVVVLDPCVKYPLGFAVGTNESANLIKAALRNAAQHTEELFGRMYRAHQIQSDHYAMKQMLPYYSLMGDKVTPAKVKNAKAKVIEPYFLHLNKTYCQMQRNWSGFGITSDKEKQANSDFLNSIKKQLPDFEGVCAQVAEMIRLERESKRAAYMELWERTEEADRLPLSPEKYLLHFGESTGRRILLQSSGLHPTILGQKRDYDCFDITFRDHYSTHWEVRYDPNDLRKVLAVSEDESLQYILEEKYIQPMALKDRKEGDSEQLQRVREFNRQLEEKVAASVSGAQATVQELFDRNIQLDTYRKLMITDSEGQHKNYKKAIKQKSITPVLAGGEDDGDDDIFGMY